MVTTDKSQQIKLGIQDGTVFGQNKKFKIRLTSKKTGRKIDFNIDFKLKNNTTEESQDPDKWGLVGDNEPKVDTGVPPTETTCEEGFEYDEITGDCVPIPAPAPPEDECP